MISFVELDGASCLLGRVLSVVVNNEISVDVELGSVVTGDSEFPLAGRLYRESTFVADGEPLDQIIDAGEASTPLSRGDIPFACIDDAKRLELAPMFGQSP